MVNAHMAAVFPHLHAWLEMVRVCFQQDQSECGDLSPELKKSLAGQGQLKRVQPLDALGIGSDPKIQMIDKKLYDADAPIHRDGICLVIDIRDFVT